MSSCWTLVERSKEAEIRKILGEPPRGELVKVRGVKGHLDPSWEKCDFDKVHEWRRYVSDEVQKIWHTFTPSQKAVLALQAQDQASQEEWE
jgi:hypothetical protein